MDCDLKLSRLREWVCVHRAQLVQGPHGERGHLVKSLQVSEDRYQGSDEMAEKRLENLKPQCLKLGPHSKSRGKAWQRLRRRGGVVTICALCSSHWEMYYDGPKEMRVKMSCQ